MSLQEVHAQLVHCRELTEHSVAAAMHSSQYLNDAAAIMNALASDQEQDSACEVVGADFSRISEAITQFAVSLASSLDAINPYLQRNGMPSLAHIAIRQLEPAAVTVERTPVLFDRTSGAPSITLPTLQELIHDESRGNQIAETEAGDPVSERQALQELDDLLAAYIDEGTDEKRVYEATSMRASFNFVSERELGEACDTIATDWKQFLDTDPESQILIVPGASRIYNVTKSDTVITERILEHFDDAKDIIGSRIVGSTDNITAPPEKVRVILLDDWTISGKQLSVAAKRFADDYGSGPYVDRMEVNLVVATPDLITEGFMPLENTEDPHDVRYTFERPIPVKAAHVARVRALEERNVDIFKAPMHITGAHSVVDFGFSEQVYEMNAELSEARFEAGQGSLPEPKLLLMDIREEREYPRYKALFAMR